jgi:16S rRNA (cytosine1402-N4)-methyltransferase
LKKLAPLLCIKKREGMEAVHTPVLPEEVVQYLAPPESGGFGVDATLGEGGHAAWFLKRFPSFCLAGVDADEEILSRAKERLAFYGGRIRFFNCWAGDFFSAYPSELPRPDRILFDLGISLYHYEVSRRGFSFRQDEFLDMRLDTSDGKTAVELIAGLTEKELADIIYKNAEERYSRRIAAAIKKQWPVTTTYALAGIVAASVPAKYRRGPIHPATRTFQAIRMAVNDEAEKLSAMLESALCVLKTGGRMGVISFHSGEDRLVKRFFRSRSRDYLPAEEAPINRGGSVCTVRILTPKPVTAGEEERRSNPPCRSAKFRAVEKINETGVTS